MRTLPTFRQLLVLFALACVVPMACLALGLVAYEYQRERRQVEGVTISTARALMSALDERLASVQRSLQALSQSPALPAGDYVRLYEEALVLQRAERVASIVLLAPDGHQLMNTRQVPGAPLPVEAWPQMLEASRTGKPAVLDLFRSPSTGHYVAGVGIPLAEGATLNANVDPEWLREVLVRQDLPHDWIAAVLDRSGVIAARTHDPGQFVGTRARAALVARIAEVPQDAVRSTTVDGIPVVTAFSRSERSGWSVVIGIPRSELQAPLWRSSAVLLAGTAAVLLLTLGFAWRLSRSLGDALEALGASVRATGHRATLRLPPPAFQEAHQLGQALLHAQAAADDAAEALERSQARVHAILDTATDAIVTADGEGRIVLFNRAAQAMFGLSEEDAIGRNLESLLPPEVREVHVALRQAAGEGTGRPMAPGRIVEGLRSDGRRFRAAASISVAHEDGGGRLYTAILREADPALTSSRR